MLERVWRKGNLPTPLVGMKVGAATMKNRMEVPQKTKNRITIWSSNPTSGHISRWNYNSKRYMHPYVHSSTIHNIQDIETTYMSINRWMDKDVVHIYNGILLSHKKEWNNAIFSNMDATRDYHTKWSKSDRERQTPYANTYIWNLKKKVYVEPRGRKGLRTQT